MESSLQPDQLMTQELILTILVILFLMPITPFCDVMRKLDNKWRRFCKTLQI